MSHARVVRLVVVVASCALAIAACEPPGRQDADQDAGADAHIPRDEASDAGESDAGELDGGEPDSGEFDAGAADAGEADAGCVVTEALELSCDGVDNDCDGLIDERWVDVMPISEWRSWATPILRTDAGFLVFGHEDGWGQTARLAEIGRHLEGARTGPPLYLERNSAVFGLHELGGNLVLIATRSEFQVDVAELIPFDSATLGFVAKGLDSYDSQVIATFDAGGHVALSSSAIGSDICVAYSVSHTANGRDAVDATMVFSDGGLLSRRLEILPDGGSPGDTSVHVREIDGRCMVGALFRDWNSRGEGPLFVRAFDTNLNPLTPIIEPDVASKPPVADFQFVQRADGGASLVYVTAPDRDGGVSQLRLVEGVLDGGTSRTLRSTASADEFVWSSAVHAYGEMQLLWKEQSDVLPDGGYGDYFGHVYSARLDGSPKPRGGTATLQFPLESRPGTRLVEGFDGWMVAIVPVVNSDGGSVIRAIEYCAH